MYLPDRCQGFCHGWTPSKSDRFAVHIWIEQLDLNLTNKGASRVKKVKEEKVRMCFKMQRFCSKDTGLRREGHLNVRDGKTTAKPATELDLEPSG